MGFLIFKERLYSREASFFNLQNEHNLTKFRCKMKTLITNLRKALVNWIYSPGRKPAYAGGVAKTFAIRHLFVFA